MYACFCGYFLFFLTFKCLLIFFNDQERLNCIQFFGGQFSSIKYFVQLFIVHHLIVYTIAYPLGKNGRKSKLFLQVSALFTIILCKLALYFLVYVKEDASATVRAACAGENVRIMMKCISFFHEVYKLPQENSRDISIRKVTYFLFAPTLIYRSSYERTRRPIDWRAFFTFMSEFVVLTLMWAFFVKDVLRPAMLEHKRELLREKSAQLVSSYIRIILVNSTNFVLFFFYCAFGFLHSYSNAMAELMTFANRKGFYKDWWINNSAAEMLQKWNQIVGEWLREYIYKWLLSRGCHRLIAMTIVFLISGFYHDYIVLVSSCHFMPLFLPLMSLSIIPYILSPYTSKKLTLIQYNVASTIYSFIFCGLISYYCTYAMV